MNLKNFRNNALAFCGVAGFYLVAKLFTFSADESENKRQAFSEHYRIYALNVPETLLFAGEKVPLELFDVRERLDRELLVNTYWQSQTLLFHKRVSRWFPVIEPILKHYGIPDDFKYISVIESGLTNVISPSGAVGYWQFLEETGKRYGLEINDEIDERYHMEKATEAACRYFKDAYEKLGKNWTLAAASYNMGITGVKRLMDAQKVNSYYDLLMNEETFRYIFRIMAVKEIITRPDLYGYHFNKSDLYSVIPYRKITVDTPLTDLAGFALAHQTNYKYLKLLNPWLRKPFLSNKQKKKYTLKLLKPGTERIRHLEEEASVFSPAEEYMPGETIPLPSDSVAENQMIHKVEKLETIFSIAKKYGVTTQQIRNWNSLDENEKLRIGQELIIFTGKR